MDAIDNAGLTVVRNPYGRKLTETETLDLIETHRPVAILAGVESLTSAILERAKGLKIISRCGVGMDSVDLVAASTLGITVTNTPDGPTLPVAELTVGLMLSLIRKIHVSDSSIRHGQWERPTGNLLFEKTVGIIGCGRIGTAVAKLLAPFGVRLLGFDPFRSQPLDFPLVAIDELLSESDLVSLHLPFSDSNLRFIDTGRLAQMKHGSFLINASRGGLVDEEALAAALASGHLAGAALDCFGSEPYLGPLAQSPKTLLTAHIGSYAKEARVLMERQATQNILIHLEPR